MGWFGLSVFLVALLLGCEDAAVRETRSTSAPGDALGVPGKIDSVLAEYMETAPETELIPVLAVLVRQLTQENKGDLLSGTGPADREERRGLLVNELKRIAESEQGSLLALLRNREEEGQASRIRSLWLTNAVGVRATKRVITELAALRSVRSIHFDPPRPVKAGITEGVTHIRADKVWTSYTGTGVTVAILDTGVDYNHSDLKERMWINVIEDDGDGLFTPADCDGLDDDNNLTVDDVIGYDFSGDGDCDPAEDEDGWHGTFVAGIVAGDGKGGTNTGVAPGATIMALKETAGGGLSTQNECIQGMQYVLDNGAARVINFSGGFLKDSAPLYSDWRTMVDLLMDAGVLFVTVTHNDGDSEEDAPWSVRTPGNVPMAMTLGGTHLDDERYWWSNTGPVTWEKIDPYDDYPYPPGLIKPDATAPAVQIMSTEAGGTYTSGAHAGTSYAAAFASGVAALLLEKEPNLTPYELKFILEETAVELGVPGPDNVYGWGRIDAESAVVYEIDSTPYDLSVTGTNAVWTTEDIWIENVDGVNLLYARVRNIGGQVASRVEVKFYYADVGTIGISGFDPDGDGDPDDGNFTFIGSYAIPTVGPGSSRHGTSIAVVPWDIPKPTGDHWCVGVGVVAPFPPNEPEGNTSNNVAFKNFFDIEIGEGFAFNIVPPPAAPDRYFEFEMFKKNVPHEAKVQLLFEKAFEDQLIVETLGLSRVHEALLDPRRKPMSEAYFEALESEISHVRYEVIGERAILRRILSRDGRPIPARILVTLPEAVELSDDALVVLSTLDQQGRPVGGLTLRLRKRR